MLDLCLIEVSDHALGSVVSAGPTRLEAAGRLGIPQVVAPAGVDAVDIATWQPVPRRLRGRPIHAHNRLISVVRTTADEKRRVGRAIARKLNRATGPTVFAMPLGGVDEWDRPGEPMHDPDGLAAMAAEIRRTLPPRVRYVESEAHVNDEAFSRLVLELFDEVTASMLSDDLLALDRRHLVHPYLPVGDTAYVVFERGEGVFLHDVDGRRFLDARSQLNCVNLGYGHPRADRRRSRRRSSSWRTCRCSTASRTRRP